MKKSKAEFNFKRFLSIFIPFSLVAILLIMTKSEDVSEPAKSEIPNYYLHIESKATDGSIILNEISIAKHQSGDKLQKSTIALTPWLKNGQNKLYINTNQYHSNQKPFLKASLEIHNNGETITKALFNFTEPQTRSAIIDAQNLPQWSWQKGSSTFHDMGEIQQAVKELHQAFADKNKSKIRKIERPLFDDMIKLTGREGLDRRHFRDEIIKNGKLDPLSKLIIIPFANGRVMRVTLKDGEAPIRVYYRYGKGGKVILTGKFWSKIDGQWFVVR